MFPIWLHFRGGKGIATALGSFALLTPRAVLVAALIFATTVAISRYVSLGSIIVVILFPVLVWRLDSRHGTSQAIGLMAVASLLILIKHRGNIQRLGSGTEPPFRWKRR
jgi:glycerol-3-phosphate acyltransferase PlsY